MTGTSALCANRLDVVLERNVEAKMRDGVTLRADIYRPKGDVRYPVLLMRTPYDKNNNWSGEFPTQAAAHGYVVIIQDVRGRYSSDGEWYPFKNEQTDGYDTVEWAAGLPYANGKVGMWGGSYVGATQMLAAMGHPPHLAGICPVVTASNYHDGWTYQGGAFEQWFNESWTSGLAQDTLRRAVEKHTNAMLGAKTLPLAQYPLFNFSGTAVDSSMATLAPYFLDWLQHPEYDEYWKRWSIEDHYADIQVPALTIAAWYDIFQGGSLRNYAGLKTRGGSEAARKGQRLLVVIGGHAGSGRKIGDVDFGAAAEDPAIDQDMVALDWYDYLLKGEQNALAQQKPVKIFVMGRNEWREENDWPLARARERKYFLHSSGKANSAQGDGLLAAIVPAKEHTDEYLYDPGNPVPTTGGPLCCDGDHLAAGPKDQSELEARTDVLVYSTPPMERDFEVTGPVRLEFYAKSSAVDTDFTAKLVDVEPGGFARNLTEGIVRARYRESQEKGSLLEPGKVYRFTLDLWSTSNVFLKGHRVRLEISSSNFPRFDRNLNTGEGAGAKYVSATNTIYHDVEHPSALVLPVVEP
jgi:putative CocE/NonD family hydrolase